MPSHQDDSCYGLDRTHFIHAGVCPAPPPCPLHRDGPSAMAPPPRLLMHACRHDPPLPSAPQPVLDGPSILAAVEGSLRRLQTDYLDLYQIHWWVAHATALCYLLQPLGSCLSGPQVWKTHPRVCTPCEPRVPHPVSPTCRPAPPPPPPPHVCVCVQAHHQR